jgi:hypothetical protein
MSNYLSFDEFSAVRNRERKQKDNKNIAGNNPINKIKKEMPDKLNLNDSKSDTKSMKSLDQKIKSLFTSIGDFIEMHETQTFCIFLIFLDTFLAYSLSIMNVAVSDIQNDLIKALIEKSFTIIKSLTAFTQIYFMIELTIIIISFGFSVIGHLGYTVDIFIVASQFYFDLMIYGRESRVLNIFRLWRIYRLIISLVNTEKYNHENTKVELENTILVNQKLEIEKSNMEEDLKREKEARTSVEQMLQDYKEEVDTLNEALKIAARGKSLNFVVHYEK